MINYFTVFKMKKKHNAFNLNSSYYNHDIQCTPILSSTIIIINIPQKLQ